MRFDGIDCIGEFKVERLSSLPGWTADDEGRMVYTENTDRLYIGTNSVWRLVTKTTDDVDLTATAAEINTACDGITATAAELNYLDGVTTPLTEKHMLLFFDRPKFTWKDADEIYIGAGSYYHQGTTDQLVYWDSQLTVTDNAITNEVWHYLYLYDAAIVSGGSPLLTASQFTFSITSPTWSDSKHGWYNGNDRCIFAVHDYSGNIWEFYHDGGRYVGFDKQIKDHSGIITTSWTSITLTIPKFGDYTQAQATFQGTIAGHHKARNLYYRRKGSSSAGHTSIYIYYFNYYPVNSAIITVDGLQRLDVRSYYSTITLELYTDGYFLPNGM